jgi:hypothetical protein
MFTLAVANLAYSLLLLAPFIGGSDGTELTEPPELQNAKCIYQ